VFDEPALVAERPGAAPVVRPLSRLRLRDVSFSYRAGGPRVLDRVDLDVAPGTVVGLVGPSGSGKSTLLALAARLYDVEEGGGAVLHGGTDVRALRVADLRRAVVLVPQRAFAFDATIRSNLLYMAPGATDAEVRRVLEAVDLADTVDALPLRLETPVGDRGMTLSGGQRQRLALARALLADPAVLLMDNCTSALDAETERKVWASLRALRRGRSCLIVSHRLTTLRDADRVVVLDGGRVAEQGTHDGLMERGGYYARAFARQVREPSC